MDRLFQRSKTTYLSIPRTGFIMRIKRGMFVKRTQNEQSYGLKTYLLTYLYSMFPRSLVDVVYALRDEVQELKQVRVGGGFPLIFKFIENYI